MAPEIKQTRAVYERPSCKEPIFGKMLTIEKMSLCALYLRYTHNQVLNDPVSRDQIFRCKRGEGNINFPCSVDHEQDWQPYYPMIHTLLCVRAYVLDLLFVRRDGWQKTPGSTRYTPRYFLFFSPSHKGPPTTFRPRFFRPQNVHIFVVFRFCFAVCHEEWPYYEIRDFGIFRTHDCHCVCP